MIDALKRVYSAMDPQSGMFPAEWTCRACHKRLNADGHHPAELYAGTYTGLCYDCERAPYYVEKTYALDGAMVVSYPPSSPSWRRDRETYKAYADCETCKGLGVEGYVRYSTHRQYCRPCLERYCAHPLRQYVDRRTSQLYRAAESTWQKELARVARTQLPKKVGKRATEARVKELVAHELPRFAAIRAELLARHKKAIARLAPVTERIYEEQSAMEAAA